MKRNFTPIILLLTVIGIFTSQSYAARLSAKVEGDRVIVNIDGKLFTSYKFADDLKRPYFYPVVGPASGKTVTVETTEPYPHHNSLFFGCDRVNGGNYWQEGNERGQIISQGPKVEIASGGKIVFTDTCLWVRPGKEPVIRDMRRVTITAPSADIRFIDFEVVLDPLTDILIEKTNHSFFSARMTPELNVEAGGTLINAEGKKNADGTFGVSSAWCDFYGIREGITEGLAIFQSPTNRWYPSKWFTRDYGFMSPTPMYWPENGKNTTFAKGEKLKLSYRVVVHAGDTEQSDIANIFKSYENEKSIENLKGIVTQIADFKQGNSRVPLIKLADIISKSYDSGQTRKSIADMLIGVATGDGTFEGKKIACEYLSLVGDGSHVEALAKLLGNEKTADIAIFALQRIADNKASKALIAALDHTAGRTKAGVINALAHRRTVDALPELADLINDKDTQVAKAAIAAMGQIASRKSIKPLTSAMRSSLKADAANALLDVAEGLVAKGNESDAARIYADVYNSSLPTHIAAASLRGLIASGKADAEIDDVLAGDDGQLQSVVFESVRADDSGKVAKTIAGRFNKLSNSAKVQFLSALSGDQQSTVDKVVIKSVTGGNADVRVAGLKALGRVGGKDDIMLLAEVAARAKGDEAKAASQSLVGLVGDNIDTAIIKAIDKADGGVKCELISAVADRRIAAAAADVLMDCLVDDDSAVRAEVIKALRAVGTAESMHGLIKLLLTTESSRQATQIEKTLVYIVRENGGYQQIVALVAKEYGPSVSAQAKMSMLNVLGQVDDVRTVRLLQKGVGDSNSDVRRSAIKGLSEYVSNKTADLLAGAAKDDTSQINRILAVKGYIKVVTQNEDATLEETVAGLAKAMKLAQRVEEKKAVLAVLSAYRCQAAVDLAKSCLADETLKTDAQTVIEKMKVKKAMKFDFQPAGGVTAKGYVEVATSDVFNMQKGFGWVDSPGASRDRQKGSNLSRDFVFDSRSKIFKVKLANGKYKVTVFLGDMSGPHDKMEVLVGSELKLKNVTAKAGEVKELSFDAVVSSGVLELTFKDGGGSDANWVCAGLTIESK